MSLLSACVVLPQGTWTERHSLKFEAHFLVLATTNHVGDLGPRKWMHAKLRSSLCAVAYDLSAKPQGHVFPHIASFSVALDLQ